jgi:hypothetical protein
MFDKKIFEHEKTLLCGCTITLLFPASSILLIRRNFSATSSLPQIHAGLVRMIIPASTGFYYHLGAMKSYLLVTHLFLPRTLYISLCHSFQARVSLIGYLTKGDIQIVDFQDIIFGSLANFKGLGHELISL